MEITLKTEVVGKLSSKGVLAYIAVSLADGTEATTASLAGLVRCQTVVMLEGLKELAVEAAGLVAKAPRNKWRCGVVNAGSGVIVGVDSERYRAFVDDLKKYWDNLNPKLMFAMGGKDGAQIRGFLKDHPHWTQQDWRQALIYRKQSVVKYGTAPASAPLWTWVGRLDDYAAGPLDRFGKPVEGGGKHGEADSIRERNREAVARAVANA
jgi:hypothetical protein